MKIVADYKKRKELKEYLPHEEHWKLKSDRKSVGEKPGAKDQSPAILAPSQPKLRRQPGRGHCLQALHTGRVLTELLLFI